MMEKTREGFVLFLEENNIREEFVKNFKLSRSSLYIPGHKRSIEIFFSTVNPQHFIGGAFVWSKTEQGYGYWRDIDNKWLKFKEKSKKYNGITNQENKGN